MGVDVKVEDPPPLLHPDSILNPAPKTRSTANARQCLRSLGIAHIKTTQSAAISPRQPPSCMIFGSVTEATELVVKMVIFAEGNRPGPTIRLFGDKEQVGGELAVPVPLYATEQVS